MQLLVRFFLSLVFFLISGYGYTHALSPQDHNYYAATNTFKKWHNTVSIDTLINDQTFVFRSIPTYSKRENNKIYAEETEDESFDLVILKKAKETSNYFTSFYAQQPGYFCHYIKNSLPSCKHFFYCSSQRSIILQVIRI